MPRRSAVATSVARVIVKVLAVTLAAAFPAAAQVPTGQGLSTVEPSELPRCLVVAGQPAGQAEGIPSYPFLSWKNDVGAEVEAELRFVAPDQPPEISLQLTLTPSGRGGDSALSPEEHERHTEALRQSVEVHLRRLRLPCQSQQPAPTVLRRVYDFRPGAGGFRARATVDSRDDARRALMNCVRHVDGVRQPEYPRSALRDDVQGNVLVVLQFLAPDAPPVVKQVMARPSARPLSLAVQGHVQGLRMPCLGVGPAEILQSYKFRLEGEAAGLRPLTMRDVLSVDTRLDTDGLTLDTRPMGCPFDVRLWYRQPDMPNGVSEVGPTLAARQPLIDYLRGLKIAGSALVQDAIFGDSTTVTVQCLDIAIPPKEKRS